MDTPEKIETIKGPVMALDLGSKRVGVALSDKLLISTKRLPPLSRSNWKQLLKDVTTLVQRFDAQTLVIGLPLRLDGVHGSAAIEAKYVADKFSRSLEIPVYLQDERLTSAEATERLRAEGHDGQDMLNLIDSESAVIILADFIDQNRRASELHRA